MSTALLMKRCCCCPPCDVCVQLAQPTPSQWRVTISGVELCEDCYCYTPPPGGEYCHRWIELPDVGPNGVFTLDRLWCNPLYGVPYNCTWRGDWPCSQGQIGKWWAASCAGDPGEIAEVNRFYVDLQLLSAEIDEAWYYWAILRAYYGGCLDAWAGAGYAWALTGSSWDGDPENYAGVDCRGPIGPIANLEICAATETQFIADCLRGGLARNGTASAEVPT